MNTNKISYNKYIAEVLGTLILVLIAALSGTGLGSVIFVGLTLAFIVYLFGDISGAHVNPAFTIAAWTMKKIKWQDAILYICSQLIGAGIALIILKNIPKFVSTNATAGVPWGALLVSEIIGMIIFSFAFSAAIHGKTTKSNVGFVIGLGLSLGLLFASIAGGPGVLNPAVAIGTGALHWATIVGPILGALIGAWLYRVALYGKPCGCDADCDSSCSCGICHKKAKHHESSSVSAE